MPFKCSMVKKPGDLCPCSLEGVMSIIGKKWSILIIGTLGNHRRLRYNELQEKLGKISPKTLTARLKELESIGLVGRQSFNEIPPRVEYFLTEEGEKLFNSLLPLIRWAIERDHRSFNFFLDF
ncbi:MAG: helix-turn-helix transcriptional regulator [Aigarchaeota archaeon]|nr:helix-turn-helix transcriptional regulator [Candidatus Pelearchaeum maunauluense]